MSVECGSVGVNACGGVWEFSFVASFVVSFVDYGKSPAEVR